MKNLIELFLVIILTGLISISCTKKYDRVQFGVCSDMHLNVMHDPEKRITTFIDSMNIKNPDFIIELGDFTPPEKEYLKFFDIWGKFNGDKHHVIGNHDSDGGFSKSQILEARKMDQSYYSFDKNGFHFIVLDGNEMKSPDSKIYYRFIGKEQIRWLKEDLFRAKFPVIIFSHQELFYNELYDYGKDHFVENWKEVMEIFESHNSNQKNKIIACFNGHTHNDYAQKINNIWFITIASMSYKWLGRNYQQIRYSDEIDKNFPYIKYTAPFKDPLFATVEISTKGYIKISGSKSEWVGPSPWELGYPDKFKNHVKPQISDQYLEFNLDD